MIFTEYLLLLLVICGLILSFIYPAMISQKQFPLEYKIGKFGGYLYIGGAFLMWIVTSLL
jgi:predicted DNA-binding transcriptional regulator AlpA